MKVDMHLPVCAFVNSHLKLKVCQCKISHLVFKCTSITIMISKVKFNVVLCPVSIPVSQLECCLNATYTTYNTHHQGSH